MTIKKVASLTILLSLFCLEISYGQNKECPSKNDQAKKKMIDYLSKDRNIQDLREDYGISFSSEPKNDLIPITGKEYRNVCEQLYKNVDWLKELEDKISIYKIDDHYFFVRYNYDKNENFQSNITEIINGKYKGVGAIIDI